VFTKRSFISFLFKLSWTVHGTKLTFTIGCIFHFLPKLFSILQNRSRKHFSQNTSLPSYFDREFPQLARKEINSNNFIEKRNFLIREHIKVKLF